MPVGAAFFRTICVLSMATWAMAISPSAATAAATRHEMVDGGADGGEEVNAGSKLIGSRKFLTPSLKIMGDSSKILKIWKIPVITGEAARWIIYEDSVDSSS